MKKNLFFDKRKNNFLKKGNITQSLLKRILERSHPRGCHKCFATASSGCLQGRGTRQEGKKPKRPFCSAQAPYYWNSLLRVLLGRGQKPSPPINSSKEKLLQRKEEQERGQVPPCVSMSLVSSNKQQLLSALQTGPLPSPAISQATCH